MNPSHRRGVGFAPDPVLARESWQSPVENCCVKTMFSEKMRANSRNRPKLI